MKSSANLLLDGRAGREGSPAVLVRNGRDFYVPEKRVLVGEEGAVAGWGGLLERQRQRESTYPPTYVETLSCGRATEST